MNYTAACINRRSLRMTVVSYMDGFRKSENIAAVLRERYGRIARLLMGLFVGFREMHELIQFCTPSWIAELGGLARSSHLLRGRLQNIPHPACLRHWVYAKPFSLIYNQY